MTKSLHNQKTISQEVCLEGVGLHTGKNVNMCFKPAEPNQGFTFKRVDLEGHPFIPAQAHLVVNTSRGTTIEKNGVSIHTTEHVLAACVGLDLDNIIIELNEAEPPILDGSAKFFYEALEKAGVKEQNATREEFIIEEVISFSDEASGSEVLIMPADEYKVTTMVDFGTKVLGTQNASITSIDQFKHEIASARTFSFLHEIEELLSRGLIRGGDLNNAIVYVDKELNVETTERLKKAFNKENISIKSNGILDNLTLHFPNEAARHKLLDIMGDLALVGTKIRGKVIANKPGHSINTKFAKKLAKVIKSEKRNKVPKIDLSQPPLYDVNKIMEILPHRAPFLLIDKIYSLSDHDVIGIKNVTMNETFFQGHFPSKPLMPGVLQVEAMAQTGGILALSSVNDPENYLTYFIKMNNVKFKRQVVPGDTLIFKLELLSPIRRGICHMQGYAYANDLLTCEAELMAQLSKIKD